MKTISNRQSTLLRKLNRKKYREKEQLFLVEGERAVQQIIENGVIKVQHLFFDEQQQIWNDPSWRDAAHQIASARVAQESFLEFADTDNPQGVLALCEMPGQVEPRELAEQDGIVVATDRIQDPGNLGTIVRSATWFHVAGILLGKGTVDLFNPKVVRSTAGATGVLPFANIELTSELDRFRSVGWQVLMLDASPEAENLREIEPPDRTLLVIGNEAHGISDDLSTATIHKKVKIPAPADQPKVESLNASVALSVALYALSSA